MLAAQGKENIIGIHFSIFCNNLNNKRQSLSMTLVHIAIFLRFYVNLYICENNKIF